MFNPLSILVYRGSGVRPSKHRRGLAFLYTEAKTEIYSSAKCERCYDPIHDLAVMIQLLEKSVQTSNIWLIQSEKPLQLDRPVVLGSD